MGATGPLFSLPFKGRAGVGMVFSARAPPARQIHNPSHTIPTQPSP